VQLQSLHINCLQNVQGGVKREKTNKMQQSDVYYQLLSQHVSGIIMPIFRRTKTVCYSVWCTALVLLDVVGSGCGALRCRMRAPTTQRPKTATNHIQQNQHSTPYAVTNGHCSPEDEHNYARNML